MLNQLFVTRLQAIVPPTKFEEILQTFTERKWLSFRVNRLKAKPEPTRTALQALGIFPEPVSWYEDAFLLPSAQKTLFMQTDLYQQGHLYLQDLASMLAPLVLDPQPGERILDLTAAPGSKTSQIAALMQNTGHISAVEQSRSRFFKLKQNLETQGVSCAKLYNKDGRIIWRHCPEQFDRVLLDAPCSSEARFRIHEPESYRYWSLQKIKEMARNQWSLLNSAVLTLKPGGILVYSTCSFAPEENEANLSRLLTKYEGTIQLEPISLPLQNTQAGLTQWQGKTFAPELTKSLRILPTENMSGFFLAKIKKTKP